MFTKKEPTLEDIAVEQVVQDIKGNHKDWYFEACNVFIHKTKRIKIWYPDNVPSFTHFYYNQKMTYRNAIKLYNAIQDWYNLDIIKKY